MPFYEKYLQTTELPGITKAGGKVRLDGIGQRGSVGFHGLGIPVWDSEGVLWVGFPCGPLKGPISVVQYFIGS